MNLEKHVQKTIVTRTPSSDILEQISQEKKFIILEDDFDKRFVPPGYSLIDMRYKETSFRALVPQSLLFFMVNPGDGNSGDALDQIADFYEEAEYFEDDLIENGKTNVQEANWATLARDSYYTYLINHVVKSKKAGDDNGEPIPEFDRDVLNKLDLDSGYVLQRVEAIAALALGKKSNELGEYCIENLLKHVSIPDKKSYVEEISQEEFKKITKKRIVSHWDKNTKNMRCLADSHYDLLPEYRNSSDVDYDLRTMTKKVTRDEGVDNVILDSKISELEKEIGKYRQQKHGEVGRHDSALIRMYINLAYILPENKDAKLDIKPPRLSGDDVK